MALVDEEPASTLFPGKTPRATLPYLRAGVLSLKNRNRFAIGNPVQSQDNDLFAARESG